MKNIGDPIERRDGGAKVTGAAKYAYEHRVRGVVYGVLVTSNIAKGRIVEIDTTAAEKEPGVIAIILCLLKFGSPRKRALTST